MTTEIYTYAVHTYGVNQNLTPFILTLALGWAAVFAGTLRWGTRFAAAAVPIGLVIPVGVFLLRPEIWRALLDPEIAAWNAAYWLVPAVIAAWVALALRRRRTS